MVEYPTLHCDLCRFLTGTQAWTAMPGLTPAFRLQISKTKRLFLVFSWEDSERMPRTGCGKDAREKKDECLINP